MGEVYEVKFWSFFFCQCLPCAIGSLLWEHNAARCGSSAFPCADGSPGRAVSAASVMGGHLKN